MHRVVRRSAPFVDRRAAERYRHDLPHAEWVELEDVGHAPQLDVPAVAADLIRTFA